MFGAAIVVILNDELAGLGEWALIAQGVILLVVIVFFSPRLRRRDCGAAGKMEEAVGEGCSRSDGLNKVWAFAAPPHTASASARRTSPRWGEDSR